MKLELVEYKNGEWGYRFRSSQNNNILTESSEGYDSKGNAKRALLEFISSMQKMIWMNENAGDDLTIVEIPYTK